LSEIRRVLDTISVSLGPEILDAARVIFSVYCRLVVVGVMPE
jgi:hypothetical protein